jgi:hypothetical protein
MTERLQAAIRLLYPDEMTPHAKRILEAIIQEETKEAPANAGASVIQEETK